MEDTKEPIVGEVSSKSKSKSPKKDEIIKLKELVESKVGDNSGIIRAALFAHTCPDPDAVGSMMGMSWFLKRMYNIECDIFYHGEIAHPQNKVMCNLLEPQMIRVEDEFDAEKYDLKILLDTIPENAGTGKKNVDFDIVIDHHRELPSGFKGLLIHYKAGSCCGIIYQIINRLLDKELWFDDDVDADCKVATAMIAGIATDTDNGMSDDTTEIEWAANQGLFPFRNTNYLKQIVSYKRPKFWIDAKATACSNANIDEEGYAIVGLGIIPEKDRDLIADMADEMVSWASVETAIAFGIVGGNRLEGSVRSLNASVSVPELCKKLGGKYGQGGGKHGKGAYKYTLGGMSIDQDEDEGDIKLAWDSMNARETKRIDRVIKK